MRFAASLVLAGAALLTGRAQTLVQWTGASSTAWGTTGNWSGGNVPNSNAEIATFSSSWTNTARAPTIGNTSFTIGGVVIQSSVPSTNISLAGGTGTLTIDPSGWSGTVGVDNQSTFAETIGAKLAISGSQTWQASNATGGSLTFSGTTALGTNTLTLNAANATNAITVSGVMSGTGNLAISGNGTTTLSVAQTYSGTTTIDNGATLKYTGTAALSNSAAVVVNSGGTYNLNGISDTISSVAGGGNISLGAATLTTSGNASTTFSGGISGTGGLSKGGTGTLTLTGASSNTGVTTVSAGVINAQNASALGNGAGGATVSVTSGAALQLEGGITVASEGLTLSGTGIAADGALRNISGNNTWSGNIGLAANSLIQSDAGQLTISGGIARSGGTSRGVTFGGSGDIAVSGAIAGTVTTLTKSGTGNLILSSASNAYTGATTITGGTLALSGSGAIPTTNLVLNGGVLAMQGTFSLPLGNGTGAVQFGAAGGGFAAYGGALSINGFTGTPVWGTTNHFLPTGGALIFGSTIADNVVTWTNNFSLGTAARTITVNDNVNTTADYANISSVISSGAGGGITKNGAGLLELSGSNTYTGATLVSAGTLNLQNNNALGTGSAGATVSSGAALELQGGVTVANEALTISGTGVNGNGALRSVSGANTWNNNITLAADATVTSSTSGNLLTIGTYNVNTITMGANTLTMDGAGNTLINSSVGVSGNTGGFVKNGTGTTTFRGLANNYTGTTTVNAGTLILDTDNTQVDKTILGNLVIGVGGTPLTSVADSVVVQYGTGNADNKIANTSQVTINSDGKLDLNARNDTIGSFVLNGGHIDTETGVLTLNGNVTTNTNTANRTAVIDGVLDLGNATRTFSVANGGLTSDLTVNAELNFGSIIKMGTGTMTLTNDNSGGYGGTTTVSQGVLNIQNSNALGQSGNNDPTKATSVANLAALQLQGGISVGTEALTLNGTGVSNDGALRNVGGTNSWAGTITLGSAARINSDIGSLLNVTGDIIGTNVNLTAGGAGATNFSGAIGTGTGSVTMDGTGGTLTLSGTTANTFSGGLNVNDGTVILAKSASVNAAGSGSVTVGDGIGSANSAVLQLGQNEQIADFSAVTINSDGKLDVNGMTETIGSLAGSGTLAIGSGSLIVGNTNSTTFSGTLTGAGGTLTKQGSGSLTITSSTVNFTGNVNVTAGTLQFTSSMASITGTLTLGAVTLVLSGSDLTVGTIHITGATVIDFTGSGSILSTTNLLIDSGASITLNGWVNAVDYFLAQNWSGATINTRGTGAETQVTFDPPTYTSSQTAWLPYGATNQITPVPEPATYGAMLIGASLAFLGVRRFRRQRLGRR